MLHVIAHLLAPETAHKAALCAIKSGIVNMQGKQYDALATSICGMHFSSPVGIAAGFDKNAECAQRLLHSSLGFMEFGTVTLLPQDGNPKPRVWRVPSCHGLINALGFPNVGAARFMENLSKAISRPVPCGINIGMSAHSLDPESDYMALFQKFYLACSYIVVNISSPNTVNLRNLQQYSILDQLLTKLTNLRQSLQGSTNIYTPYFIKISPDINDEQISNIAALALHHKVDGLVLTNTTISREGLDYRFQNIKGGLSGKPLFEVSNSILRSFYIATKGNIPLIGVGGISSAEDAYTKIKLGASLVQLYTGLIYKGLGLINDMNSGLDRLLRRDGFDRVCDAVGSDVVTY